MNKKTIQILVIVAAFGGSGWLVYSNFFKSPSAGPVLPGLTTGVGVTASSSSQVSSGLEPSLGGPMDFTILRKNGLEYGFRYPKLATTTDIGVELTEILKPQLAAENQQ
jgi:hypothetical protein